MSVIAWDGKIIAADRQAQMGGLCYPVSKLKRVKEFILGWTGSTAHGLAIVTWYLDGRHKKRWPEFQKTEDWARLIVFELLDPNCITVVSFEQTPEPQPVMSTPFAWGCGAEFAMGAMEMGADAIKAVQVASKYNPYCGMGVQFFSIDPEQPLAGVGIIE